MPCVIVMIAAAIYGGRNIHHVTYGKPIKIIGAIIIIVAIIYMVL